MFLYFFTILFLALPVLSFHAQLNYRSRPSLLTLSLSPEEAAARLRGNLPQDEEPAPKIFDDEILDDMQSALLKLEKRVQDGPGGLSVEEVDELEAQLQGILQEMKLNPDRRVPKPRKSEDTSTDVRPIPAQSIPPSESVAPPTRTMTIESKYDQQKSQQKSLDTSEDEGPMYDGRGGMGQPRGTVNTYAIDGMDEMTPEEYQIALQQKVIQRAEERRVSGKSGGNVSALEYMKRLAGRGGMLKDN